MDQGFLLIDKPKGITSHDVVDLVRKQTGERRVGHAGTLDPLATGLMIVAVGRENTKQLSRFLKMDKEYEAEIEFGKISKTFDAEGPVEKVETSQRYPKSKEINVALRSKFTGEIFQTPPAFSAIKVKGKPAYKLARAGKDVKLEARKVVIHKIEILGYTCPILKLRILCSSGTYIRSIAHDLGQELGVGGYLKNLRRTGIGKYSVTDAK
jgi:tRNA pseudouridine55 synthase